MSCRSQLLHRGFGAEEKRENVSPGSGSCLLRVRRPEVTEQKLRLRVQHQEVPWQPEAQTVPAGGLAGRSVSPAETGETQVSQEQTSTASKHSLCLISQLKIMNSKTLCAEKIP